MNNLEIVNETMRAFEQHDFSRASNYVADDFQFVGPTPEPVGKKEFVKLHQSLIAGIPDWSFNWRNAKETKPGTISGQVAIGGTHSANLDLSFLGIGSVPATNKRVKNPTEELTVTVKNGKVSRMEVSPVSGGGLQGILTQIGAKL